MFPLRKYQAEASDAVWSAWREFLSLLLVMPTGTGKTRVFSEIVRRIVYDGGMPWVVAHRGELLNQAAEKIERDAGIACAIEKAEFSAADCMERCIVASVQTLINPERCERLHKPTHIIIDEGHHATSQSYTGILARYPEAHILGVTATPDRSDQVNLGSVFQHLAFEYTLPRAIEEGFLSPITAETIPLRIDISNVGMSAGDFAVGDLGDALAPYMERIVNAIKDKAAGRKTLVFAPLRQTARTGRDLCIKAGLRSAYVGGDSDDRVEVLAAFEAGEYDVLWNAMLLTEGYDCPSIDCVVVLRPTKSRPLYCQCVGRGTRIFPGKKNLLLLDFLWITSKHSLCHPACVLAPSEEVAEVATAIAEANGYADITMDLIEQAERNVQHERETALVKKLKQMASKKGNLLDPLAFAAMTGHQRLLTYSPGLNDAPPSMAQVKAIAKRGIYASDIRTAHEANEILAAIGDRQRAGMAPPNHIRTLEKLRFSNPQNLTEKQSSEFTRRIAANGWRVPHDLERFRMPKQKEGITV